MATSEVALARRSKAGHIDHFLYPVGDHLKTSILWHSCLLLATSSAAAAEDCSLLHACVGILASDDCLGLVWAKLSSSALLCCYSVLFVLVKMKMHYHTSWQLFHCSKIRPRDLNCCHRRALALSVAHWAVGGSRLVWIPRVHDRLHGKTWTWASYCRFLRARILIMAVHSCKLTTLICEKASSDWLFDLDSGS